MSVGFTNANLYIKDTLIYTKIRKCCGIHWNKTEKNPARQQDFFQLIMLLAGAFCLFIFRHEVQSCYLRNLK